MRSGRNRRTGAGPPTEADVAEEHLPHRQLDPVRDADVADQPAGPGGPQRLEHGLAGADALQHGVRADAVGELLDRAMPSSPRSVTSSVAPNARASSCRGRCRLIAITRSAPSCAAASTPHSPTAPSPTTATVMPGATPAHEAACQPVLMTSESDSRLGDELLRRLLGRRDQRAVGLRHADQLRLAAVVPAAVLACRLDPGAAVRAGVVGVQEPPDHELTRPYGGHGGADLLDDADVLVADVARGAVTSSSPRYGHRSDPQIAPATTFTMASVGPTTPHRVRR